MKIAPDKWKHFYVGIPMGMVLQLVGFFLFPGQLGYGALFAFVGIVVISYGFELFSLVTGKGHHELMDAVAAVVGGFLGQGVLLLGDYWIG
ncbi:hypothetical protein GFS24_00970 [Chitinophaga sp. SYP-B3965]|uniref:hypothetical protein n=1 Tax=Chitinophaga sp. SYP-B3965 TaxID=2663120 RepID=UPI001299D5D4|nr:hypothetical protein [Chitinophaga sp. SYP-B3965]MRG43662.1 hypothetical protein [Chitinophaga sp. SYP-B3965]